jgi:transposase
MSEDIEAAGASALVTGHMSDRMSSRIAVVGGRRRWSVDQKLSILREAFGPDGSGSATCQRHAVGSGMLYTWRRQALSGDLTGTKRTPAPSFAEVEMSVPATATAGSGQIGIELPSGMRITGNRVLKAALRDAALQC